MLDLSLIIRPLRILSSIFLKSLHIVDLKFTTGILYLTWYIISVNGGAKD
jgi:hypothetical protein